MSTVRAAVLSPGAVQVKSFPRTPPPEDGLLLRVEQCGICGSDKHLLAGHMELNYPVIPGHEFVGRVTEIGPHAPDTLSIMGGDLEEGDRVVVAPPSKACGSCWYCLNMPQRPNLCANRIAYGFINSDEPPHVWGALSNYMYVHGQSWVYKVPDGLPLDRAVLAEPTAISLRAIERAYAPGIPTMHEGLGVARSVVVIGTGPVGLLTVAGLKHLGAGPVIATDLVESRLEMATNLGADVVVNVQETTQDERLRQVRAVTEGVGADVVIEAAGVPAAFAEALELARRGGKVIELGHYTDPGDVPIRPHIICNKDLDIHGSWSTPQVEFKSALAFLQRSQAPLEQLITHRFSLEQTAEAIELVGGEEALKIVVVPSD